MPSLSDSQIVIRAKMNNPIAVHCAFFILTPKVKANTEESLPSNLRSLLWLNSQPSYKRGVIIEVVLYDLPESWTIS